MNKLIQTIQEQIDLVMNSKCAKYSDKQMAHFQTKYVLTKEVAIQIIDEYKKSNEPLGALLKRHGVKTSTFGSALSKFALETPARNIRKGVKKPPTFYERKNDIISGMSVRDWCLKWEMSRHTYYQMKKKMEKNLVDSKL